MPVGVGTASGVPSPRPQTRYGRPEVYTSPPQHCRQIENSQMPVYDYALEPKTRRSKSDLIPNSAVNIANIKTPNPRRTRKIKAMDSTAPRYFQNFLNHHHVALPSSCSLIYSLPFSRYSSLVTEERPKLSPEAH